MKIPGQLSVQINNPALSQRVRAGEVTPLEAVEAALAHIDARNPSLNAVIFVDREGARTTAQSSDRRAPLAGVPILIKDNNLYVEGWPTTYSCRYLEGSPPRRDSAFVTRLRRAGAVLIGKTNLPEFAANWTTEPTWRRVTRNPWDLSRSPGGSSGGSAAAVASGMVPVAHGNDGSIRVPAAVCGLFGLKPSRGLTPAGPHFGELANGHNSEFVLTRTVRDAALLLDVLAGPEADGRYHVSPAVPSYVSALSRGCGKLRVGLVTTAGGADVDPEIAAATERCARLLAGKDGSLTEMALPPLDGVFGDSEAMWALDALMLLRQRERECGRPPRSDEVEALTRHVTARVSAMSACDIGEARLRLHRFAAACHARFDDYDLIVTPTTAQTAPSLGYFDSHSAEFDYEEFGRRSLAFAPFTEIFNLTGQPAASVFVGLSSANLPIGVQIASRMAQDHVVLAASAQLHGSCRSPDWW